MMDLAHQRIVNRELPARRRSYSFLPHSGRETGDSGRPFPPAGVSLTPFWVLWFLSNLLSVGLGMALSAFIGGGA